MPTCFQKKVYFSFFNVFIKMLVQCNSIACKKVKTNVIIYDQKKLSSRNVIVCGMKWKQNYCITSFALWYCDMVNDEGCQNLGFRRGFLTLLVIIVVCQLYYLNHDNVTWYAKDRIRSPIIYKDIHEIQMNVSISWVTTYRFSIWRAFRSKYLIFINMYIEIISLKYPYLTQRGVF